GGYACVQRVHLARGVDSQPTLRTAHRGVTAVGHALQEEHVALPVTHQHVVFDLHRARQRRPTGHNGRTDDAAWLHNLDLGQRSAADRTLHLHRIAGTRDRQRTARTGGWKHARRWWRAARRWLKGNWRLGWLRHQPSNAITRHAAD